MFKKIRSNRDPGVTVYAELKKIFAVYLIKIRQKAVSALKFYPRTAFVSMIVLLIASGILCFTIERTPPPKKPLKVPTTNFDKLSNLATMLRQSLDMKKQVDSILRKKTLNHADSLTLETDLDRLKRYKP